MERKWAMVIAVAAGILAMFLTYFYFQRWKARFHLEEAPILIASKDIYKGSVIDYKMLVLKPMPVKFIQPGALSSRESAVGKSALVTILAGEQILATKLAAPGAGLTLAGKTPPGKRAVTIGLDAASAVGGMIKPGDHVDILAIFITPAVTISLLQDVLILAVGQQMVPRPQGRARRAEQAASPTRRETITLALTPQEVRVLTVAMEQGKIRLTLRPRMEKPQPGTQVDLTNLPAAIDVGTLLQFYIRRPDPGPSVEVIRGLKREITPLPSGK